MNRSLPKAVGLYDPTLDHDACGVAFVARLDGPTHDVVARSPRSSTWTIAARRAPTPTRATAPDCSSAFPMRSCARRSTSSSRPRGPTASRSSSSPPRRAGAPSWSAPGRRRSTARTSAHWAGATSRSTRSTAAARRAPRCRGSASCSSAPGRADRGPGRLRAQAVRDPPDRRSAHGGPDLVDARRARRAPSSTRACSRAPAARASIPTSPTRAARRAVALVHSRFSTNTFPSWELAHPYRMIAHNGEINTLRGNRNWMRARESQLASRAVRRRPAEGAPQSSGRAESDSATFDNVLELLMLVGPLAPARADDDDPRGVGGPRRHARGAARLLRLPLVPDGAVGRPGGGRLHRRPRRRRDARPQRPAARPLGRDHATASSCSPRETGVLPIPDRTTIVRQGPPAARASCSWSTSSRGASSTTPRSSTRSPAAALRRWFARARRPPRRRARAPSRRIPRDRAAAPPPARLRLHARRTCACCSRRWPRPARSRRARWATTSRWRCCRTARRRCSPTSSSSSPRSPTRRSTRSARRS